MSDDDVRLDLLREIISRAVTAAEAAELELPHLVICTDRQTGHTSYAGPFPDALAALTYAEIQAARDRAAPEDPLIRWSVSVLLPPEPIGPRQTPGP